MENESAELSLSKVEDAVLGDLEIPKRHIKRFVITGLFLELALIMLTRFLQIQKGFNFFTEGTYFTWISAIQLVSTGLVAFAIAYLISISEKSKKVSRDVFAWLGAGFLGLFFSVTEWFSVHEAVAPYSGKVFNYFGLQSVKDSYWDLLIFSIYVFAAVAVWFFIKKDLYQFELSKLYLLIGVLLLSIGLILDTAGSGIFFVVWEDSFKLLGFFFILSSFLGNLIYRLDKTVNGEA